MDNERRFESGKLVLFTRNGIWQARIAIGNRRYLWKTLETSNEADAKRAGYKLFHRTEQKLEEGLPVQSRSFSSVLEEYETYREDDHDIGKAAKRGSSIKYTSPYMLRQIKRVSKFWHEYAGKRSVEAIDDKILADYIPWRKTYYHDKEDIHPNAKLNPTDKTLQWEIMLAKMVLKYALERGYLGKRPLPKFTFTPKTKRVRPHFTATEFRTLRAELRRWVEGTTNPTWKKSRQLLHDYVHALGMAGLRTGEANNLRVRDVDHIVDVDGRPTIQLFVRGKTGTRTVQPHIELGPILQRMIADRGEVKPNDLLFVMPNGDKIITVIDQFNKFLSHVGLTHTADGAKYTLYSLRHYYAVRSLGRADIYSVAQNMGTSVQMIEQYYGKHGITPERARRLAGEVGEAQLETDPVLARKKVSKKVATETAAFVAAFIAWSKTQRGHPAESAERKAWAEYSLTQAHRRFSAVDIEAIDRTACSIDPAEAERNASENGLLDWFNVNKHLIESILGTPSASSA